MVDIQVEPRETDVEPVNLGEFSYEFAFPKSAPLLTSMQKLSRITDADEQGLASLEARNKWLAAGFGPEQWAHIEGRLDDETDPLDHRHMQALFQALFQEAAKDRPPMLRGGSSDGSPQTFQRAAKPNPYVSTQVHSPSIVSATS